MKYILSIIFIALTGLLVGQGVTVDQLPPGGTVLRPTCDCDEFIYRLRVDDAALNSHIYHFEARTDSVFVRRRIIALDGTDYGLQIMSAEPSTPQGIRETIFLFTGWVAESIGNK